MELVINGETQHFEDQQAATVASLMRSLELDDARGTAVAHNDAVVPRGRWENTELRPGDRIEIIRATQGG